MPDPVPGRDALLVVDADGAIVAASPAATSLLEHAADGRAFRRALCDLAAGGAAAQLELHIDGRTWHAAVTPVDGGAAAVVSLLDPRDVETAAERTLERLPLAAVALDPELRVVFANPAARRAFGGHAVEPGVTLGLDATHALMPLAREVAAGVDCDASLVDVGAATFRVRGVGATAELPGLLLAAEATGEVQHERVMREFLRNAAHQLRTPLAGITAAVETLQSGAKERPADRDRFLAHVSAHADRLARIARGLLLLARAETGETLHLDAVPLLPMISTIVAEVRPRDDVKIRTECEDVAALASPDILHETIAALVDNAVAYTERGEVTVGAVATDGTVSISVSDTGPGIPPELQERIFEPFFRIAATGDGYGLGLAIAAESVRALRGELAVSSTPGAGTTFTVVLPAAWSGS